MRTTSRLALCGRAAHALCVLVSYKSRIPMCVLVQKAVARLCTTLYEVCREVADPQVTLLYPSYWCFLPVPVPVLVGRA